MGLPVLRLVPHACMPSPLPRQVRWKLVRSYIPIVIGLPRNSGGSAPASPFSRPARRSQRYGLQTCRVALATLYIGGFSSFVASTAAPIATGWNEPVPGWGFHPLWTNTFSRRTELTRLGLLLIEPRVVCRGDGFRLPCAPAPYNYGSGASRAQPQAALLRLAACRIRTRRSKDG